MALLKNNLKDARIIQANKAVEAKDFKEAWRLANEILADDFDNAAGLYILGYVALQNEQNGLAYNLFRICANIVPEASDPWNNMGMCYQERWGNAHDLVDAEKCFATAHRLDVTDPHALNNLSLVNIHKCLPDLAIDYANKALKFKPDMIQAVDNKAMACLMAGRWQEGWAAYERALGHIKERTERKFKAPPERRWDGTSGQNVVFYGTQGIGDEISFASILPDAIRDCRQSYIECDRRLEGLFKRSFPQAKVFGTRWKTSLEWPEDEPIDAGCSTDILGKFYRNSDAEFPGTPYLKADPERRLQWKALLDHYGKRPKIGLAWTGGLPKTGTQKRSLSLMALKPLIQSVDATWVSLQYKNPEKEISEAGVPVIHWPRAAEAYDFDDVAALVSELDLVISVTTAIVHLSGALGKEAWVIAPRRPRWFYQMRGDTIPWYKSVRIFRQTDKGEWPIKQISNLLSLRYDNRKN